MNELPTASNSSVNDALSCPNHVTLPECPTWCVQITGHPFDCTDETGDVVMRFHRTPLGDIGEDFLVELVAREVAFSDDGPSWTSEPWVQILNVATDDVIKFDRTQTDRLLINLRRASHLMKAGA